MLQTPIDHLIIQNLRCTFVHPKALFHAEIHGSMYGMQQRPEAPCGHIRVLHLRENGAERLHHNCLSRLLSFLFLITIIAARSNHFTFIDIRLGVTNQYNGKHIHLLWIESAKGCYFNFLLLTPCLTDIAHRSVSSTFLQEKLLQAIELPIAAVRLGIIDSRDKIANSGGLNSTFNHFPRCHKV